MSPKTTPRAPTTSAARAGGRAATRGDSAAEATAPDRTTGSPTPRRAETLRLAGPPGSAHESDQDDDEPEDNEQAGDDQRPYLEAVDAQLREPGDGTVAVANRWPPPVAAEDDDAADHDHPKDHDPDRDGADDARDLDRARGGGRATRGRRRRDDVASLRLHEVEVRVAGRADVLRPVDGEDGVAVGRSGGGVGVADGLSRSPPRRRSRRRGSAASGSAPGRFGGSRRRSGVRWPPPS